MSPELTVDLQRPPHDRWLLPPPLVDQARRLVDVYFKDMGLTDEVAAMVEEMAQPVLTRDYQVEIRTIADQIGLPVRRVLACNLYYDLLKPLIGCTAFAVDTEMGPLHARNLDWWSEKRLLNETSLLCRFVGGRAGDFITIGWPGLVGTFSGLAPGRFAVTLNAVISGEPTQVALPVTLLLRSVLADAASYQAAVRILTESTIPGDCLLLISGPNSGEMVVIERTPTRHAVRHPSGGHISVANEFLVIDYESGAPLNQLQATSCGRFQRISELLTSVPATLDDCLTYLSDPGVRMDMTVQQMAFRVKDGTYRWRA